MQHPPNQINVSVSGTTMSVWDVWVDCRSEYLAKEFKPLQFSKSPKKLNQILEGNVDETKAEDVKRKSLETL